MLFNDFLLNELLSCFIYEEAAINHKVFLILKIGQNLYHKFIITDFDNNWLDHYNEIVFFQIFRMKKGTFQNLMNVVLENDTT